MSIQQLILMDQLLNTVDRTPYQQDLLDNFLAFQAADNERRTWES